MSKIKKLVQGVHMGLGHVGLAKMLRPHGIKVEELTDGDLVMCLNTYGDKLKIIGGEGLVLGYLRMPRGQRIMKEALQWIPHTFGSKGFDYDAACKKSLEDRFRGYPVKPKRGPLEAQRAKQAAGV